MPQVVLFFDAFHAKRFYHRLGICVQFMRVRLDKKNILRQDMFQKAAEPIECATPLIRGFELDLLYHKDPVVDIILKIPRQRVSIVHQEDLPRLLLHRGQDLRSHAARSVSYGIPVGAIWLMFSYKRSNRIGKTSSALALSRKENFISNLPQVKSRGKRLAFSATIY